ncbi:YolD-like family protein [Paenibacillus sp. E194]|uniref:YolD-like family protein n=1 Tax=Paenibacillus sp. E194 TaxID=1458845 RepID=UPI0005C896F8|nr:YolD-like family protein [Paenibacillus sp. E194]
MSKLQGNGIWESSRMMLPEHKIIILRHQQESGRRSRPVLDEQEWERIGTRLQQSMVERELVTVQVFDPFECKMAIGVVVDIDVPRRRVKLQ